MFRFALGSCNITGDIGATVAICDKLSAASLEVFNKFEPETVTELVLHRCSNDRAEVGPASKLVACELILQLISQFNTSVGKHFGLVNSSHSFCHHLAKADYDHRQPLVNSSCQFPQSSFSWHGMVVLSLGEEQ